MHKVLKSLLTASALALAVALPSARAQLFSGATRGEFHDPNLSFTSVINSSDVSLFQSGVPSRPAHTQTSLSYSSAAFGPAGAGDQIELGTLLITNGRTLGGTTASWATLDVYLNLPEHGIADFKLTTLTFSIDNTENNGSLVPDQFLVSIGETNTLTVDGRKIAFDVQLTNPAFGIGTGSSIAESTSAEFGLFANVHFTPVPEPSTYALLGAVLLVGVVAYRRLRPTPALARVA